ncbi:oligosaccharide flippase family protein [Falsiroseomonas sp. E2-1-a20]|uniref:oligosaccharide flippase family protein n=1 Tax=Falsiroseomonas sp. E2-1-a20 TaxID=3239300 RepID=UPI003F594E57
MTTEPTGNNMLARTARGAFWVVAWRMSTRVMGLCSTLILVRLLAPGDFGLIALATSFAVALEASLVIGVEDQIVRAKAPSRAMYDTGFTLNLLRGLLVAVLIVLIAAPAGRFFGDARLEPVLLALALSAALSGLANIGVADFRRHLQFEREFALNLYPRMVGIVVTVTLAFLVQSHWALVAGILTNRLGAVLMSYLMHPFRPRLTLSAWRDLAGVSAWSWGINVAHMIKDRIDSVVIGRVLGTTSVGHYAVGMEVAALPATELVDPICRACMPGFAASRRADGGGSGQDDYLRIMSLMALLILPAGVGISAVAGPVVALGFGQAWLEAVPVVAVLGIGGILTSFGNVSMALLSAHTRLATLLSIALSAAALRIALLLMLVPAYGITGAALAVSITVISEHLALLLFALSLVGLRLPALLARLWRPVVSVVAMALLMWKTGLGWAAAPPNAVDAARLLLTGVALGASSYILMLSALWAVSGRKLGAETDLFELLRRVALRVPGLRIMIANGG